MCRPRGGRRSLYEALRWEGGGPAIDEEMAFDLFKDVLKKFKCTELGELGSREK